MKVLITDKIKLNAIVINVRNIKDEDKLIYDNYY